MTEAVKNASTDNDIIPLSPTECVNFLVGAYHTDIKRTPLFRGAPGIGKTSIARQAADILREQYPEFHCVVINPTMPADEVGGIPKLTTLPNGEIVTKYALPDWFPTKTANPNWRGIIVLDDALQGAGEMQKVLANLVLERSLRGHELPDGAMICVTGNRTKDKAGVARTLTHFADRMCWLNVESFAQSWIDNYAIPYNLAPEVIAYIMRDGSKLNEFDPNKEKCPTPRTWAAVSNWIKYIQGPNAPKDANTKEKMAIAILAGELGMGNAVHFWAFCNLFGKLPDINDIFKHPDTHSIDYDIDVQYALVVAIAQRMDAHTFAAGLEYIDRIGADLSTMAVKVATRRDKTLTSSAAYTKWSVKNQDVLHGV